MAVSNDACENKMIQHACEAFADSCACAIQEEGPGLAQAHPPAPFSAARVLGRSDNIEMSARDTTAFLLVEQCNLLVSGFAQSRP